MFTLPRDTATAVPTGNSGFVGNERTSWPGTFTRYGNLTQTRWSEYQLGNKAHSLAYETLHRQIAACLFEKTDAQRR